MVDRQRIPLLLFSTPLLMSTCCDHLRARTYAPFRAELTGVGPADARHRTQYLLENGEPPSAVLAVGLAYWLSASRPPDIPLWAIEVRRRGKATLRPNLKLGTLLLQRSVLYSARLVTLNRLVTDRDTAVTLAEELHAEACDTEAYSVIDVCIDHLLPCGVICDIQGHAGRFITDSRLQRTDEGMNRVVPVLSELLGWLNRRNVSG